LVRRILAEAANYLTPDGVLIVEVGVSQHFVEQVYEELPLYWFEFTQGGEGVFAISREELEMFDDLVQDRLSVLSNA
jgi:ribosomal protein L3 glutamine methyltransferase